MINKICILLLLSNFLISEDVPTDIESIRASAEYGNAANQYLVGLYYYKGNGNDKKEGARWLAKAAESGNGDAQSQLGFMYATGRAVEKNDGLALQWTQADAKQGNSMGEYNLGVFYYYGLAGLQKDEKASFEWVEK